MDAKGIPLSSMYPSPSHSTHPLPSPAPCYLCKHWSDYCAVYGVRSSGVKGERGGGGLSSTLSTAPCLTAQCPLRDPPSTTSRPPRFWVHNLGILTSDWWTAPARKRSRLGWQAPCPASRSERLGFSPRRARAGHVWNSQTNSRLSLLCLNTHDGLLSFTLDGRTVFVWVVLDISLGSHPLAGPNVLGYLGYFPPRHTEDHEH